MIRVISAADIELLADLNLLTQASEEAFLAAASGSAQVPLRMKFPLQGTGNRFIAMPAHLVGTSTLVTKVLTVCPDNHRLGQPVVNGVAILADAHSGAVLAILEGSSLTGLRTAAASAVATRALARRDVQVLSVIGTGLQGKAHVRVLSQLYDLQEVRLCSRRPESAEEAARELSTVVSGQVRAVSNPGEAVRGADVVVTATSTVEPVLRGDMLGEGVHICAVGAAAPDRRELDTDVIARASIVAVDTREGAVAEAGDVIVPLEQGQLPADRIVELGEVLAGRTPGRRSDADITVFKSVGTAATDAAVAASIYQAACEKGVGTDVPFGAHE